MPSSQEMDTIYFNKKYHSSGSLHCARNCKYDQLMTTKKISNKSPTPSFTNKAIYQKCHKNTDESTYTHFSVKVPVVS